VNIHYSTPALAKVSTPALCLTLHYEEAQPQAIQSALKTVFICLYAAIHNPTSYQRSVDASRTVANFLD
jgi:hypothetical protein